MTLRRLIYAVPVAGLILNPCWAIDIDPSKKNVPDSNTSRNRFDIFAGDPARIQRANTINFSDFQSSLEIAQPELSLYAMKEEGLRPNIRLVFKVKNLSPKRTYTLSFPDAQRYDFVVKSSTNQIVYKWSADKLFVQTVGITMINPGDTLGYNELLPVSDFYVPLAVGEYTVEASMANYPEVDAKAVLRVVDKTASDAAASGDAPVTATESSATSDSKGPTGSPATGQ